MTSRPAAKSSWADDDFEQPDNFGATGGVPEEEATNGASTSAPFNPATPGRTSRAGHGAAGTEAGNEMPEVCLLIHDSRLWHYFITEMIPVRMNALGQRSPIIFRVALSIIIVQITRVVQIHRFENSERI